MGYDVNQLPVSKERLATFSLRARLLEVRVRAAVVTETMLVVLLVILVVVGVMVLLVVLVIVVFW